MRVFQRISALIPRHDKYLRTVITIFKLGLPPLDSPLPDEMTRIIPHEDCHSVLSEKHTPETIVAAAGLDVTQRYNLLSLVLAHIDSKSPFSEQQYHYLAMVVLRSCLSLLFIEITDVEAQVVHVFIMALTRVLPYLKGELTPTCDFFGFIYEKILAINNMHVVVDLLPAVAEFIGSSGEIGSFYGSQNLTMLTRLCQFLNNQRVPEFEQIAISKFNIAVANAFRCNPNFDTTKVVRMLVLLGKQDSTKDLLISYLELFMVFHYHGEGILPLMKRVCYGLIAPDLEQKHQRSFLNIHELAATHSLWTIRCSEIISYHFLNCVTNMFNELMLSLILSNDPNVQSLVIVTVMLMGSKRREIAEFFKENDLWMAFLNDTTFTPAINIYDTPHSRILCLRQSVWDLFCFLVTDSSIGSIRSALTRLIKRVSLYPNLVCEIISMSNRCLSRVYNWKDNNDNLFELLLSVTFAEKSSLDPEEAKGDILLDMILNLMKSTPVIEQVLESCHACELLLSLMFEEQTCEKITPIITQIMDLVHDREEEVFSKALHEMFRLIFGRTGSEPILMKILGMMKDKNRRFTARREILSEIVHAIFLACKTNNTCVMNDALYLITQGSMYPEFQANNVPFAEIGKVCAFYYDDLKTSMMGVVIRDGKIVIPEGLIMLVYASRSSDANYNELIETLSDLCEKSICNRHLCMYGNILPLIYSFCNDDNFAQTTRLFKTIACTVCNRTTFEAFMNSITETETRILEGVKCMQSIITEGITYKNLAVMMFGSPFAELRIPPIQLGQDHNSFVLSTMILIDGMSSGRNICELKSDHHSYTITLGKYGIEYITDDVHRKIGMKVPISEWFHLVIILKPFECISFMVNGTMRAGFADIRPEFPDELFDCCLFRKDSSPENVMIQVQTIEISNNSTSFDPTLDSDITQLQVLYKADNSHYVLRADYITSNGVLYADSNQHPIVFNGVSMPWCTNFVRVFEATHSINVIIAMFRKIDVINGLLEALLNFLAVILSKGGGVGEQIMKVHGFEIMAHALKKASSVHLSMNLWNLVVRLMGVLDSHFKEAFAGAFVFNLNLWKRASVDIQYNIVNEWHKLFFSEADPYAKKFLHLPFLFTAFAQFSETKQNLDRIAAAQKGKGFDIRGVATVTDHKLTKAGHATKAIPKPSVPDLGLVTSISSSHITRSISANGVTGKSGIAGQLQKLRNVVCRICKGVIDSSFNETDSSCLFQAIHNAANIDETMELLELLDYLASTGKYPDFKMQDIWLSLFLHASEDVRIYVLDIFYKLEKDPSLDLIDNVCLLLILQAHRPLNSGDYSGSSLLCDACRLAIALPDHFTLSDVVDAPIIVRHPAYIHFALVMSFAAPTEVKKIFAGFIRSVCVNEENLAKIAKSSTTLTLFLLVYWSLTQCCAFDEVEPVNEQQEENLALPIFSQKKPTFSDLSSFIRQSRRRSLPLTIDAVNNEAIRIVTKVCAQNPMHLAVVLDIIDSISLITTVDLTTIRTKMITHIVDIVSKEEDLAKTCDILILVSRAVMFHHKVFHNPEIMRLIDEFFPGQTRPSAKRYTPKVPDLITIVNAYSGDAGVPPQRSFSLEYEADGSWKDKKLTYRLIFLLYAQKSPETRPVLLMLLYFFMGFAEYSECSAMVPLIQEIMKENMELSDLANKALSRFHDSPVKKSPAQYPVSIPMMNPVPDRDLSTPRRRAKSNANHTVDIAANYMKPKFASDSEEIPEDTCNHYQKAFESLNRICSSATGTLAETHTKLCTYMKSISRIIPRGAAQVIHLVQQNDGEHFWKHFAQQMKFKQSHYKRSSVTISKDFVPTVLKRNFNFEMQGSQSSSFNNFQKVDLFSDIVSDSKVHSFQTVAQRIKIDGSINGTLSIVEQKKIRFLSTRAKSVELDVSEIEIIIMQVYKQRKTAVEIFTKKHRTYLFNMSNEESAEKVYEMLYSKTKQQPTLEEITEKWIHRTISNFEYLMHLNRLSGRSFNFILSYPIFPWIVKDYTSKSLALEDPETYRDLSKPIGALNPTRLAKLKALSMDGLPFLYQSSYSCPFHICHYLVRLEPFTSLHISLQDGKFDVAARLFTSVGNSYDRVVGSSMNFRELIPEFFFCPEFLSNTDEFQLGEGVNNVVLPPWGKTPAEFIYWHRRALESEYVSAHIHEWIDLIWGYKQTGEAAVKADNVFDPRLYPDVWQKHRSESEKDQIDEVLSHLGQIPQQLFTSPHPKRNSKQLQPAYMSIYQVNNAPVVAVNERFLVCHSDGRIFSGRNYITRNSLIETLSVSVLADGRFGIIFNNSSDVVKTDGRQLQRVKRIEHIDRITCCCAFGNTIVTGGRDGIIATDYGSVTFGSDPILCVGASDENGLIAFITSSRKVTVVIGSNFAFVRSFEISISKIFTPRKIVFCEGYGYICVLSTTESASIISLFTLNGVKINDCKVDSEIIAMEPVTVSCSGLDYLAVADKNRRVGLFLAFEMRMIKILAETDANVTSLFYDKANEKIMIGTHSGQILYGQIGL